MINIEKGEYEELVRKAHLFDHFIEVEALTQDELKQIRKALKTHRVSESEFLGRHPDLG